MKKAERDSGGTESDTISGSELANVTVAPGHTTEGTIMDLKLRLGVKEEDNEVRINGHGFCTAVFLAPRPMQYTVHAIHPSRSLPHTSNSVH